MKESMLPWDITKLSDIATEESFVHAMVMQTGTDRDMAMTKCKQEYFYDVAIGVAWAQLKIMEERQRPMNHEDVRAFLTREAPGELPTWDRVQRADPAISPMHALGDLEEWWRKRQLHLAALKMLEDLHGGISAAECGREATHRIDGAVIVQDGSGLKDFATLEAEFDSLPPLAKIPTGIPFLDQKLSGGIEEGKLTLLFGDPEAGKTSLGVHMLRNISLRHKVLFFPFEFSQREFIEKNKALKLLPNGKPRFDPGNFYVDDTSTNLVDLEIAIKTFALQGGKVILIDSQLKVENSRPGATSEERETEKFVVLQNLAIRYGLSIFFICQQGKEDARSNIVTPMKSKNGAHLAHIILYIERPKDAEKGERVLHFKKNKQTGREGTKPVKIDPRTLEFSGRQYDDDDPRSRKTVGSGRPKKKPIEVVYEEEDGTVTGTAELPLI